METYKKTDRLIKKLMSFFAAALILMGTLVPDAVVAQAAVTLNVAQYVSAGGTVSGEVGSNSGKYSGKWEAHIPMGKVMSAIESEMKLAADNSLYPHGKDGKNTIAYIEYTVTFPAGVNIDSANIQKSNTTAMFNGGDFSHSVNGQSVYFRFPLKDENWKAIYNYYKNDGGAASDKTIDITIPYSASASGSDEAKAFEAKTISAAGSFETHASGTLYSFTKTVYYTDNSSQPAAKDFSSSDVFAAPAPPPTPTPTPEPTPTAEPAPTPTAEPAPNPDPSAAEYKQTLELDADLRLGDDTGNKAITKKQWDDMDFTGVLDAKAIKGQLAAIEASYPGAEAGKITLKNLTTGFTATLTLPDGLSFVKSEAILAGANGKFEIESVALENQTATVKFKLVDADKISDFAQLKAAVNAVEDELKVIFKTAKFAASATAGTDYEVTGAVTGKLTAEASYTASHKTVNFDLTWNGRQSESGKSETNPNAIAISVNYPQTISLDSNLDGDLLVNGNTQHEEVYTAKKNDSLTITGLLDVAPIKKQMKKIEDEHTVNPEDIAISNLSTKFTSDITLPEEMKFADGYTVELTGANGKFEITDKQLEGKKLTLTMTLAGDIKTFKDIKEAVEGVDDQLKVNVKGVMFDADKAKANTNYTMKGTLSGMFQARATNTKSGKVIDFNLSWYGKQLEGGEDSTDPATKDIKLTVKYAAPSENTFEAAQKLPGDILVGKNTEHDKVYVVSQGAKVVFTGSLDVSSVKAQMKAIEEQFGKTNVDPSGIEISDYSSAFVATLTLPEEMDFSSKPSVSLKDDNGKYKIVSVKLEGKKITVEMTVNKEVKTFADIRDAVNGMGDKLNVLIDGAKFNGKALPNKNYTVKGTMSGNLKAKATEPLSGNVINFNLSWEAEQLPEGADAINPSSKDITFTLKYTPKTVVTPKTGDSLNLFLYPAVMIISIIGLCLVYKQNKKKYTGK